MGQEVAQLPAILAREPLYPPLFSAAFGDSAISETRIARALAQFVRSLVSYQSRHDEGLASAATAADDFASFSLQENRRKALFRRNCAICHLPNQQDAHFMMTAPANTGLDADATNTDGGVGE
jgi:cytochrome c peroxidase